MRRLGWSLVRGSRAPGRRSGAHHTLISVIDLARTPIEFRIGAGDILIRDLKAPAWRESVGHRIGVPILTRGKPFGLLTVGETKRTRLEPQRVAVELEELEREVALEWERVDHRIIERLEVRLGVLDSRVRELVDIIVCASRDTSRLDMASRQLFTTRRNLSRLFRVSGLPAPSRCLQFARVARAVGILQRNNCSVFQGAVEAGFPDGFCFSNALRRLTGLRPSALRLPMIPEWLTDRWLLREGVSIAAERVCDGVWYDPSLDPGGRDAEIVTTMRVA